MSKKILILSGSPRKGGNSNYFYILTAGEDDRSIMERSVESV